MKKLNLFKQCVQKARWLLTITLLLTLGVGQMWGWDIHGRLFFYNFNNWSNVSLVVGASNSEAYTFSSLSHTKLWYCYIDYNGYNDLYLIPAAWSGSEGKTPWNRINDNGYGSNNYQPKKWDYNDGADWYIYGDATQKNIPTYKAKLRTKLSEDGGSSYGSEISDGTTWKGSFDFTGTNRAERWTTEQHTISNLNQNTWDDNGNTKDGYENIPVTGEVTFELESTDAAYEFVGWGTGSASSPTMNLGTTTVTYNVMANTTYIAFFKRKQFDVEYGVYNSAHGSVTLNSGSAVTTNSTSTLNYGTSISVTATPADGYNFDGWYGNSACSGGKISASATYNAGSLTAAKTLYAKFVPKSCSISIEYETAGYGSGKDGITNDPLIATFDADMETLTGSMPVAATGYAFMGFYSGENGTGTQYYSSTGTSTHTWDIDTETTTTLYAYYKKAEISAFSLSPTMQVSGSNITISPTVSPTPVGNYNVTYQLQYYDGTPHATQPTEWSSNACATTFAVPSISVGTYKIRAILRTGTTCGSGTPLDTVYGSFSIPGEHNITVKYLCGSTAVARPIVLTGSPTEWTIVAAHEVFGYDFSEWEAGDGLVTTDATAGELSTAQAADPTIVAIIKVKANYDGVLTAKYTQKNIIYFMDNLGWTNPNDADAHIYVNFLNGGYWDSTPGESNQGSGNEGLADDRRNRPMDRVPGTTNIFYYEYGTTTIPTNYVSFTKQSLDNQHGFCGTVGAPALVCYPTIPNPNNSTTEMSYFGFYSKTPMFVPAYNYPGDLWNSSKAKYYNSGYWTKFTAGTGYYLRIYDPNDENSLIKRIEFTADGDTIPMTAIANLEENKTYYFEIEREEEQYYSNGDNTMNYDDRFGQGVAWELYRPSTYKKTKITTTADGDYVFHLTHGHNNSGVWRLRIAAEYPVGNGDFRLVYTDNRPTCKPSATIRKVANGKDTVSFFIRTGNSPALKIQKASVNASTGAITWSDSLTITSSISGLTKDSVYNINLVMNGEGKLSVGNVTGYTGNYYIRTDCAPSKWDNYVANDHLMNYSDYAEDNSGYSHYFVKFVNVNTNIKFTIANKYSPSISDTLLADASSKGVTIDVTGKMTAPNTGVNVRFMWNWKTNAVSREYITGPVSNDYLSLRCLTSNNNVFKDKNSTRMTNVTLEGTTVDTMRFADNTNWIYQVDVYAKPGATYKLTANVGGQITFFKGAAGAYNVAANVDELIGGSGSNLYHIRMMYDFKTNRMMKAWVPEGVISEDLEINADVMLVREGQEDAQQITFGLKEESEDYGSLSNVETVYGVMQFSKYTLNNKSKTGGHADLSPALSTYERDLYWISFPFDVQLSDVFGFGTYGKHWIIEYYDGKGRAKNGFWADSPSNWKFVTPAMKDTFKLEKCVGYILALDLDSFALDNSRTWANDAETRELYFPSTGVTTIGNQAVVVNINQTGYECSIDRRTPAEKEAGTSNTNKDRRIADSYWHCIGVPNYSNNSHDNANPGNIANLKTSDLPFLYRWNATDNSLSTVAGGSYDFKAMNSYLVQYAGTTITWAAASSTTSSVAARLAEAPDREYKLVLQGEERTEDQTFVRLTDETAVSNRFEFNYDLCKEYNAGRGNIWTVTTDTVEVAGNSMPKPVQTIVVPVGVKVVANGEYTFSMPEGTNGEDVFLIDNAYGTRTNLGLTDYTVTLTSGTYDGRFALEFGPIQDAPTGIEQMSTVNYQLSTEEVRKVFVGGRLYIIRDGKVFDATGHRVE